MTEVCVCEMAEEEQELVTAEDKAGSQGRDCSVREGTVIDGDNGKNI